MAQLVRISACESVNVISSQLEAIIPGNIRRVFFIYGAGGSKRGGHRHHLTWNALICIQGSCRIYSTDGENEDFYLLDNPDRCLVLTPKDWHTMDSFSSDAILLVLSNQCYNQADYIWEPYSTCFCDTIESQIVKH